MKLFDLDWLDFLQRLTVWEKLAVSSREIFAELKPNLGIDVQVFGDDLPLLADSAFVTVYTDGRRARLHKSCHPFARAIRAMCRHDILSQPDATTLQEYIADHYTNAERDALSPDPRNYYYSVQNLISDAMSVGWLNDFLSLKNIKQAREWESRRQRNSYGYQRNFDERILESGKVLVAAQAIIKELMSSTDEVSFKELVLRFKRINLSELAAGMFAGIRYLMLFPSMRHDDMTPMINVWPKIPQRLHRPKARAPESVKPDQTFHYAYLMEDMTITLVSSSGEPLRIRGADLALFAKAQKQLESNLTPLPEWLMQIEKCSPEDRIQTAVDFLKGLRFLTVRGTPGKDFRLEPTTDGQDWLGMSSTDRLKVVLDRLKADLPPKTPIGDLPDYKEADEDEIEDMARFARDMHILSQLGNYDHCDDDDDDDEASFMSYGYSQCLGFLPGMARWNLGSVCDSDIPAALTDAYSSLARKRFVEFPQFVQYHMQKNNPLVNRPPGARPIKLDDGWSLRKPTDEEVENLWGQLLVDFFRFRLLPLGGVQVGLKGTDGAMCISLTDAGRYLLGLAKDFKYGQGEEQKGNIVVQPNFDIVFLSPAPLAEATIARFAERKGIGVGTLFKITKKSVFAAASCNISCEQVLDDLRHLCKTAIPDNVTRELRDWFDQCGQVTIKTTLLILCPDTEVATRVLAVGGKKLTPISDTVVELADHKFKSPLIKKLKEIGVFVNQSPQPSAPKPKRRHRRRQW